MRNEDKLIGEIVVFYGQKYGHNAVNFDQTLVTNNKSRLYMNIIRLAEII